MAILPTIVAAASAAAIVVVAASKSSPHDCSSSCCAGGAPGDVLIGDAAWGSTSGANAFAAIVMVPEQKARTAVQVAKHVLTLRLLMLVLQ